MRDVVKGVKDEEHWEERVWEYRREWKSSMVNRRNDDLDTM
jgi:hypothetical protein